MSERPQVLSDDAHQAFLGQLGPRAVADLVAVEDEMRDDENCRQLRIAQGWLREYGDDPAANPDHKLYYEYQVERLSGVVVTGAEQAYGQA